MENTDGPAAKRHFSTVGQTPHEPNRCPVLEGQVNYFLCYAQEQIILGLFYLPNGKRCLSVVVFFFLKATASWLLPPYSLSVGALYVTIT